MTYSILHKWMKGIDMRSEQINELAAALCKAQGEMRPAHKDSTNPHFKSKYADLASVWDTIRLPLSKNGLCVVQRLVADNPPILWTDLIHTSGQSISSSMPVMSRDNTAQAFGAGLTYAKRQALQALVGVAADEDDDGNQASYKTLTTREEVRAVVTTELSKPAVRPLAAAPVGNPANNIELLLKTADKKNWMQSSVLEYSLAKYSLKPSQLSAKQFAELILTVESKSYTEAMKPFEKNAQQDLTPAEDQQPWFEDSRP